MFYVSETTTKAPGHFHTPLQKLVYQCLYELQIPFTRVDTDEAISMRDCVHINERLSVSMVKTLFLRNRQKTDFYLFITSADKAFSSANFSRALDISRVSFASAREREDMLGTKVGAATIFSLLLDCENRVKAVFDKEILSEKWYGCSDGTTTGYLKLATEELLRKFLPYSKHKAAFIEV